jgi:DNA mismatch repair protein MutL
LIIRLQKEMKVGSRIKVLPDKVANMIAAGEVVERPASVVKELVENSIDSGASRITVEVTNGGMESISVADDGCGMGRDDALLAFERHATSKIKDESDLERIKTLGFRGEALPSIAAVSRLELATKEEDALAGTKVLLEGGVVKEVQDVGCPHGTIIVVRDLFFNLPARRKYLKTVTTEMGHIVQAISHRGNANINIHFQLTHNGRKVIDLPPTDDLRERIAGTTGTEVAKEMLKVEYSSQMLANGLATPAKVFGYVAPPTLTRPSSSQTITYVNGRHVKNRILYRAVSDAYHTVLPDGRYPVAVLFVEIDHALVDVNVHPTKIEVRFLRENDVYSLVARAVRSSLTSADLTPRFRIAEPVQADAGEHAGRINIPIGPGIREGLKVGFDYKYKSQVPKFKSQIPRLKYKNDSVSSPVPPGLPLTLGLGSDSTKEIAPLSELLYIGQAFDTYIIAQGKKGLFIIDQHAAHERVLYEELTIAFENGRVETQRLLLPISLELSPSEGSMLSPYLEALGSIGFDIEEMGKNTFVLKAFPAVLSKVDLKEAIRGIVDDATSPSQARKPRKEHDSLIALTACRGAIKAGDRLSPEEAKRLIGRLDGASMSYTCAHGRPTAISIDLQELEKKFKRR